MEEEDKNAFYLVRKGDVIGIYKTLADCQSQVGSSVCDPSVTVFKGYGLTKEAEKYLASHGLKGPAFSVGVSDVKEDTFGQLVPCPFQQPAISIGKPAAVVPPPSRLQGTPLLNNVVHRPNLVLSGGSSVGCKAALSCTLMFDGASKGNPGPSGAGAVLHSEDGSTVFLLREGVGHATNNVAEYRAVILGLKYALRKGFKHIRAQGDSKLVCMQIQGLWKINNQNLALLCKEAKELKDKFASFQINHVLRDFNSEADAQANLAINLRDGQVEDECIRK
ncbi:hypothetical protein ACFE04_025872 [Oxalis oulophora]